VNGTTSNLSFDEIGPHIFWAHKPPARALDSSNGLLICGVDQAITIDLNIPRADVEHLYEFLGDLPHTAHINTHLHLDHVSHLYNYQDLSQCQIYVPEPDADYFRDITLHRKHFGYDRVGIANNWMDLVFNEFQYRHVKHYLPFSITDPLKIGGVVLTPISFRGHGPGHVGFHCICNPVPYFTKGANECLFYSDIGIDLGGQEFGPWYGFQELSLQDVKADVDKAEQLHERLNIPMVSSHGGLYPSYTPEPYEYIRTRLAQRDKKIIDAMKSLGGNATVAELMPFNIFYPKHKIKGNLQKLVTYWEEGFLANHLKEMVRTGIAIQTGDKYKLIQ
jgi:hypothetical protein